MLLYLLVSLVSSFGRSRHLSGLSSLMATVSPSKDRFIFRLPSIRQSQAIPSIETYARSLNFGLYLIYPINMSPFSTSAFTSLRLTCSWKNSFNCRSYLLFFSWALCSSLFLPNEKTLLASYFSFFKLRGTSYCLGALFSYISFYLLSFCIFYFFFGYLMSPKITFSCFANSACFYWNFILAILPCDISFFLAGWCWVNETLSRSTMSSLLTSEEIDESPSCFEIWEMRLFKDTTLSLLSSLIGLGWVSTTSGSS